MTRLASLATWTSRYGSDGAGAEAEVCVALACGNTPSRGARAALNKNARRFIEIIFGDVFVLKQEVEQASAALFPFGQERVKDIVA